MPTASKSNGSAKGFDPAAFFRTVGPGRMISSYPKKEIIFAQGDDADSVFYIKKGRVKVTVASKLGKEAVVAILCKDEFVGEGCLNGQPRRLATAMALTECIAMRVDKKEIARVIRDEPAFSRMFITHILARNARVEEDLVAQLFNSTENGWRGCCCCWRTSARTAGPSQFWRRSNTIRSPRWSGRPGRASIIS